MTRPARAEEIFYNKAIGPRCNFLLMGTTGGRNGVARGRRPRAGIGRRELLRASFLGGSALVTAIACVAPALARDEEQGVPGGEGPRLSGQVVEQVGRAFFDYRMLDTDCEAIVSRAGPTIRTWHSIALRHLAPIDPPFDFGLICSEAERMTRKRR